MVVATLSTTVVGSPWYTPEGLRKLPDAGGQGFPGGHKECHRPIVVALLASFISAWVLAGAGFLPFAFYGGSFAANVLLTALILRRGFSAARPIHPRGL